MNERIYDLAGQAKFMAEEELNRKISYNAELKAFAEKFAELIVQNVLIELADVRLEHVFDPETDRVFGIAIDRIKTFRS